MPKLESRMPLTALLLIALTIRLLPAADSTLALPLRLERADSRTWKLSMTGPEGGLVRLDLAAGDRDRGPGFQVDRAAVLEHFRSDSLEFIRIGMEHVVRSLAYLPPATVVAFDRVTAPDSTCRLRWLLDTAGEPLVGRDSLFLAGAGGSKLAVRSFLPEDPRCEVRDCAGNWMLRVSPSRAEREQEFLHLLTAGETDSGAVARLFAWERLRSRECRALCDGRRLLVFPGASPNDSLMLVRLPGGPGELEIWVLGLDDRERYIVEWECCRILYEGLPPVDGVLRFTAPAFGDLKISALQL